MGAHCLLGLEAALGTLQEVLLQSWSVKQQINGKMRWRTMDDETQEKKFQDSPPKTHDVTFIGGLKLQSSLLIESENERKFM